MEKYKIHNRRYIGSKYKLKDWIFEKVLQNTTGESFCDLFAGTGIIANEALEFYNKVFINDFLYSNYIIYKAFFEQSNYNQLKLENLIKKYNNLDILEMRDNYFSVNFGGKYFGDYDSKIIGYIRDDLQNLYKMKSINSKEFMILLASLVYSVDKIANTVGHYEAYRKIDVLDCLFEFRLIEPYNNQHKDIKIYREDSNELARRIKTDIVFIDPPYNSRQYSRFYHVIENLITWNKPELYGVAMKPKEENMSDYCRNKAPITFKDLIENLNCKYIAVTYNNTYNSKSSSSRNKIDFETIIEILKQKGETKIFTKSHAYFNAGKTAFKGHKEFLFITKVKGY